MPAPGRAADYPARPLSPYRSQVPDRRPENYSQTWVPERDLAARRSPAPPSRRGRDAGGRGARPRSGDRQRSGRAQRRDGGREPGTRRSPLLIRGTLVVGGLLALSASLVRAGVTLPGDSRAGDTTLVLGQGQGKTAPAIQTLAPATTAPHATASPAPAAMSSDPATAMGSDPATAMGSAPAAMGSAPTAGPATDVAPGSCRVSYSVTSRGADRFTAVLTIVNTGASSVDSWTLRWAYPAAPRLANAWNAVVTTDAAGAMARNLDGGPALPSGGSTTIGFVGILATGTGTSAAGADPARPAPTGFSLNGVMCR